MENNKVLGLMGLATKAGKIIFGTDACIDGLNRNKIKLILIAEDSSDRLKKTFYKLCEEKKICFIQFATINEISQAIGKENKAVIGVKDINFSNEMIKIINGGEFIGKNKDT